ncbi:hypothetical protein PS624_01389 [Pseudomonas fluorescens]|uniref:Uncharacterized protein n=1 Tax=Pseudomonas fluorescens TaxID=294 RepID=A0A5E6R4C7_PSEFL|nr:hypothetical protein PS624_01389 [Pseudomonas fluorescens]
MLNESVFLGHFSTLEVCLGAVLVHGASKCPIPGRLQRFVIKPS